MRRGRKTQQQVAMAAAATQLVSMLVVFWNDPRRGHVEVCEKVVTRMVLLPFRIANEINLARGKGAPNIKRTLGFDSSEQRGCSSTNSVQHQGNHAHGIEMRMTTAIN